MSESPQATSESVGEGVANECPCVAQSSQSHGHRHIRTESVGEGVANECPCVAQSSQSHGHRHIRTESVGEGVANGCPCVAQSSQSYTHRHTRAKLGREGLAERALRCRVVILVTHPGRIPVALAGIGYAGVVVMVF